MNLPITRKGIHTYRVAMVLNQYYYDGKDELLSDIVLAQSEVFANGNGIDVSEVRIFVRRDEVIPGDDFGDLNVTFVTKGLQPSHYQIAKLQREPKILKGERLPV